MAGIGDDIKEVFGEVGVSFKIIRDSVDLSGEFLDSASNEQITKPFIREFFLEASLSFDTLVIDGDVIEFLPSGETGEKYLVMNKTAEIFENEVIGFAGVLYRSNVSGELLRPSGESAWDDSYRKKTEFEVVRSVSFGLQTEPLFGGELEDVELGLINIEKHELYLPSRYGVKELDRYSPVSGEWYRVESIKTRRYKGVDVVVLGEDTR